MKTLLVLVAAGGVASAEPKIPPEVTDLLKVVSGTWKCSGTVVHGGEPQPQPMTATLKTRGDLDGFWVHDTFEAKVGKAKLKYESFTTYDSRKWRRLLVDNRGTQVIGTSDGLKDFKMDFNLDAMAGAGPAIQFRDHLDATEPRALKLAGELSSDKGKTWSKVYEMTCKK
ncbi:hypothetical protein BH11MYX3_BH11MYX3_08590 [soil metagenome]